MQQTSAGERASPRLSQDASFHWTSLLDASQAPSCMTGSRSAHDKAVRRCVWAQHGATCRLVCCLNLLGSVADSRGMGETTAGPVC